VQVRALLVKSSLIPVLAVVALLVATMAQLSPSTQSQVGVRFRIASDVAVTKYSIPTLINYEDPLAVFLHDGVPYVAYRDISARVSRVVRADTGEVVKTCPLGDHFYVNVITMVAGRGTAYGLALYYEFAYTEWGFKIVDLWSCEVLISFERASPHGNRPGEYLFKYDVYADRLLFMYYVYNGTLDADVSYVALVDVVTRDVKTVFFGIYYDYGEDFFVVIPLSLHVGPGYYYILVSYYYSEYTMYIYDKNLEQAIRAVPWEDMYFEIVAFWYGLSDVAVNAHGVLVHGIVGENPYGYFLKLVMLDLLLSGAIEHSTDADNIPSRVVGVVAYRSLFVFHHGTAMYTARMIPVPYAFMLLPGAGLAINTSIAGFAVPVGYELWYSNKVVLFNPATGDLYLVDPPAVEYTITGTVTETTTVLVTYTTTETATETVTKTVISTTTVTELVTAVVTELVTYTMTETITRIVTETVTKTVQPPPLSPFLPLLLLAVVVAFIGLARASARASRRAIPLGHATAFVKKKRDHS
jgi:hypothetical protein